MAEIADNIVLTMDLAHWSSIMSINGFEEKFPVYISIGNKRTEQIEGEEYQVSDFILTGYQVNGNLIEVATYNTGIDTYSI